MDQWQQLLTIQDLDHHLHPARCWNESAAGKGHNVFFSYRVIHYKQDDCVMMVRLLCVYNWRCTVSVWIWKRMKKISSAQRCPEKLFPRAYLWPMSPETLPPCDIWKQAALSPHPCHYRQCLERTEAASCCICQAKQFLLSESRTR
jgi:hypothetical protein